MEPSLKDWWWVGLVLVAAVLGYVVVATGLLNRESDIEEMYFKDSNIFSMVPDPSLTPDQWLDRAREHCGSRPKCSVIAWPSKLLVSEMYMTDPKVEAAIMFKFYRDYGAHQDIAHWDCTRFKRNSPDECSPNSLKAILQRAGLPTPEGSIP